MPAPFIVKSVRLNSKKINEAGWWPKLVHTVMYAKAERVWGHIKDSLVGKKLLDVGVGSGSISYFLKDKGFQISGIDVSNLSIYKDIKPTIYDGHQFPFRKNEFDTAVIIHVLHHCDDGLEVLKEAKRVAKRVVVIEDTFRNQFEKLVDGSIDSVTNCEFWWHKYRSTGEWKKIIKKNGWKLVKFDEWSDFGVITPYGRYCLFVIE